MKRRLSIKTVLVLSFVLLSSLLIFGYSLLSARFFSQGVARVITDNMEITVDNYHRSIPEKSRKPVDYWGNHRITTAWKYMPEAVKSAFAEPLPPSRQLHIVNPSGLINMSGHNYYVMVIVEGGTLYYISQWIGFSTPPGIFGWNSKENIRFLVVLSCFISMGIAIVLWLITRYLSLPMIGLSRWAKNLDGKQVRDDIPDFQYRELNELASLIRTKIAAEQESLKRDQQFIHYASHELRTPITIIRQNVEVLKKVRVTDTDRARIMEGKALRRLERASDNIGALMETLLWMGRQETGDLPQNSICLDRLLVDIVESLSSLLKGKQIEIDITTSPTVIRAPEAPLRIVLTNLIRNAFQHTSCGAVTICQDADEVAIINDDAGSNTCGNLGFGFGLSLTSKLINRMNWSYQNEAGPNGHKVVIGIDRQPHPG